MVILSMQKGSVSRRVEVIGWECFERQKWCEEANHICEPWEEYENELSNEFQSLQVSPTRCERVAQKTRSLSNVDGYYLYFAFYLCIYVLVCICTRVFILFQARSSQV